MTFQYFGAELDLFRKPGTFVPLTVKCVAYDDRTVVEFSNEDKSYGHFVIQTPSGFEITPENLMSFLTFLRKLLWTTPKELPEVIHDLKLINSGYSFEITFAGDGKIGNSLIFAIDGSPRDSDFPVHEDRVPAAVVKFCDKPLLAKHANAEVWDHVLRVRSTGGDDNIYFADFKEPLTPLDFAKIAGGDKTIYTDPFRYVSGNDVPKYLVWKSIGDFNYLESNDKNVILTFEENPTIKAIVEIEKIVQATKSDLTRGMLSRVITRSDEESKYSLLAGIIELHQKLSLTE